MRASRSAVVTVAGVVILLGTGYFLLRSTSKPAGGSEAALLEDFRKRNDAPKDASDESIMGEREGIANAARLVLVKSGTARGREAGLADAFADLLTAYRQPTPEHFIRFYESRGVRMDDQRIARLQQGWDKVSLMTEGRRVAIDSVAASAISKASLGSGPGSGGSNMFVKWVRDDVAGERGLAVGWTTPVIALSINVEAQRQGPGSAYTLTIGFVQTGTGNWLPVMIRIEGATERPVYFPPL